MDGLQLLDEGFEHRIDRPARAPEVLHCCGRALVLSRLSAYHMGSNEL